MIRTESILAGDGTAQERWRRYLHPEEKLLITAASDLDEREQFAERWLLVTDKRVLVVPSNGHVQPPGSAPRDGYVELPLADVQAARTDSLVGGGRLVVETEHASIDLLTYSSTLSRRFAEAARGLQQLAKGEPLAVAADLPAVHCPKCRRVLPDKGGVCPYCVNKGAVLLRILAYCKPYKSATFGVAGLLLLRTIVQLLPPLLTKTIIDDILVVSRDLRLLGLAVLALAAVGLLTAAIHAGNSWVQAWLGNRVSAHVRSDAYQAVERLSLTYYSRRDTGYLMSLVSSDAGELQFLLAEGLPYFAINVLTLVGIVFLLLAINLKLALLVLLPAPLIVLTSRWFFSWIRGIWSRMWQVRSAMSSHLNESITGIRVTKAFSREDYEIGRFERLNERLVRAGFGAFGSQGIFFASMGFLTGLGSYLTWFFGGAAVIGGDLTIGTLMAFMQYMWMLYGPLQWFNNIYGWLSRALTGAERVFEVIDAEPEAYDAPDAVPMPRINGEIEFRDVHFGYDKSKPVLKGIDLQIEAGEMIGLVGKSGVGKTTLTNLICRFYDPDQGTALIDGVESAKIRLQDLRSQIGVVLQEPFLFNGTVAENIAYGQPGASFAEIVRAAKAANIHDAILAKPDGYDTRVGEKGSRLSVGERQRVSIARALLRDPRILILDEATASVDSETEKAIQEALARLIQGRTTIAIAHRLSTLRHASRLVVLEDGKIAELGTHDELMEKGGIYRKLVDLQREMSQIKAWDE